MDEDISLFLRQGTVPVLVQLSPADVTASSQPPPLVFTVPRQSLLCALWAPIHEAFFSSVADFGKPSAMWLGLVANAASSSSPASSDTAASAAAVPLNWHTPLGVIADIARLKQASAQLTGDASSSGSHHAGGPTGGVPALAEPLLMTAHFGALPAKSHVLPLSSKREVSILAQHCIKQSAAILFDDTKAFYKLSPSHTQALVDRAIASSADAASPSSSQAADGGHTASSSASSPPPSAASVRAAVQTEVAAREALLKAGGGILRRPLRVHNAASGKVVTVGIPQEPQQQDDNSEDNAPAVQAPTAMACRTWRDVLISCLHIEAATSSADDATEVPGHRLIVSGLSQSPMMCTPLAYLCDFFAASDMCLHVIVQ